MDRKGPGGDHVLTRRNHSEKMESQPGSTVVNDPKHETPQCLELPG